MKERYLSPEVVDYGSISRITSADATTTDEDKVFNQGIQVGELQGSLDACVTPDDQTCA